MQIRQLKSYLINARLGIKGSVVNIPIDINDILQILPRYFDVPTTQTYMFWKYNSAIMCDALRYLIKTPLYKKYNITIDEI